VISRFFIDRPIFASVLSIVITLAGGISVFVLPLAQFPNVTPPTVQVRCSYPGASAVEVAAAVASPIEQQVNGVENMMYMSSQCANDGSYNLTVTFFHGVDLNLAQVLVQNRVNLAMPQLPEVIRQTGVTTRKMSPDILCGLAIHSPKGRYKQLYLSNYALMQIKDELARVPGVGDVFLFGQRDYSMRVWVDPGRLAMRGMSAMDVVNALREQNAQLATGAIGQQPMPAGLPVQVPLSTKGRLSAVDEFANIVLKVGDKGRLTRIKDVGRVELGAKNEDLTVRLDGEDTVFLAIFQMPDANALDVMDRVMAKMADLKKSFPEDLDYDIGFDTTPYTRESILEVFKSLRLAIALVAIVVLLFLQNWRSAIIPLVAVPVAIVGTFAVMAAMGFSLNNLTLFGLVLAIGIVVDDAIVVVEAVEHHIEHGLAPREATIKAMQQVSGPVIAVGLVLSAVFVPCAFISGIPGYFFRQFALTIAVSTIISTFNSLTLSPALTALLLRPRAKDWAAPPLPRPAYLLAGAWLAWELFGETAEEAVRVNGLPSAANEMLARVPSWIVPAAVALAGGVLAWLLGPWLNRLLGALFWTFNRGFVWLTRGYVQSVGRLLRFTAVALLLYVGLLALTYERLASTPRGFIPAQDMGYLFVNVQLPDSASMQRTSEVMQQIEKIARKAPGVRHVTGISGQSFVLNAAGSNFGTMFIGLKPYPERRDPSLSAEAIARSLQIQLGREIDGALLMVLPPPPVRGVGKAGGFALMLEDRGDLGLHELQEQTKNMVDKGNQTPGLLKLFSVFRADVPQFRIEPDARACMMRGVRLQDFADTLGIYAGSLYVNDFNLFGRTWQVIVQAEAPFRSQAEDVPQLRVRNSRGAMVPIGSLARQQPFTGPLVLNRYNMYPAAPVNGIAAPGISSGDTIAILERLSEQELPKAMAYEWTDMSYLEVTQGNTAMLMFFYAVVMVFLVLAAQYESWSLPLAVILVVPMCLLSAIVAVNIARLDINIFTQIGFVVLVGLTSKNSILIVEFAKQQRHEGQSRREATLAACALRLRPIIMTSLAFILGVVPLLLSHGAGAEMRHTLGTAVFGGMIGVTVFGIFLTPVFFSTIDWLGESRLFHARWLHHVSNLALDVLALRSVRLATGHVVRKLRPKAARHAGASHEALAIDQATEGGVGMPTNGRVKTNGQTEAADRQPSTSEVGGPTS
jgi:multidrug efflux pump